MAKEGMADFELLDRVKKSPELTSYVIRNKVGEVKKNATIAIIIAVSVSFICGCIVGLNLFSIGQPKNIVEVQVKQ